MHVERDWPMKRTKELNEWAANVQMAEHTMMKKCEDDEKKLLMAKLCERC